MDNRGLQKPTLLNRQIFHIKAKHRTARANLWCKPNIVDRYLQNF